MGMCGSMMCGRCHGGKKIVTGLLLLLNAFVWPVWTGIDGWVAWVAVLMVLGGLMLLVKPDGCGHCAMPAPAASGKRKR